MSIRNFFAPLAASLRSLRAFGLVLPVAALLAAAPVSRAAANSANPRIYLFDNVFGLVDVTATFDGASVVNLSGEVVYVNFIAPSSDTGAGQHTTDRTPNSDTGAGQHTTDSHPNCDTGAGQHTTDRGITAIMVDNDDIPVGVVAP